MRRTDIPITLAVTLILTVAMLLPLEATLPAPDGSDKVVHPIAFAALSFPARTGRIGLTLCLWGRVLGGLIELIQPTFNRSVDERLGRGHYGRRRWDDLRPYLSTPPAPLSSFQRDFRSPKAHHAPRAFALRPRLWRYLLRSKIFGSKMRLNYILNLNYFQGSLH